MKRIPSGRYHSYSRQREAINIPEAGTIAILPIAPVTQLLQAIPLSGAATSAAGSATSTFAGLLSKTLQGPAAAKSTDPAIAPSSADGPNVAKSSLNVAQLRAGTTARIQEFADRFRQILTERGIDTSQPIHLQLDPGGEVRVAGAHPNADQINAVLGTQPELADAFREIAARASLLKAIGETFAAQNGDRDVPTVFPESAFDPNIIGRGTKFDLKIDTTSALPAFVV